MAQNEEAFKYAKQPIVNYVKVKSSTMSEYLDITALVEQFVIYEDLFSPFINGELTITDGLSLVTKIPFIGQERFVISFRSSFNEEDQIIEVNSYRISKIDENADDKSQVYTVFFASPEFIKSKKHKVSRSYEQTHDEIVKNIYDIFVKVEDYEYLNGDSKPIIIPEKCEDNDRVVIPAWNPMRTIDWISKRSRSANNINECTYLFFERMGEGFYYTTLQYMASKQPVFKYFRATPDYATLEGQKDSILPIVTMDTYIIENDANTISAMKQGRYVSSLNFHDPFTRTYESKFYNMTDEFDKARHVETYRPTNSHTETNFSLSDANNTFYPVMDQRMDGVDDFTTDVFLKRNAQISQFQSHMVNISVPGNSNLHIGDVIEIEIPSKIAVRDRQKGIDEERSGKYIIRSIKHQVIMNKEYVSYITLFRDSASAMYAENTIFNEPDRETGSSFQT